MNHAENRKIRNRFFANLHNDWALPGLVKQVHANAMRQTPAPFIDMDVALIGSARLKTALDPVLRVTQLSEPGWSAQLEASKPSFLLVESDWLEASNPFREALIGSGATALVQDVIEQCRKNGTPTAFWFHRDAAHLRAFERIMQQFDYVFANHLIIDEARKIRPDISPVRSCVDSSCYNPYKQKTGDWSDLPETIQFLMARAFDYTNVRGTSGLVEDIATLFDKKFWFYEDRYNIRNNNQRMNPAERCRVLGCFHDLQRAALLKPAVAEIIPKAIFPDGSPQAEQHILECLATKTLCISDSDYWNKAIGHGVLQINDASEFRAACEDIERHPVDAAIKAHQGWREVMENHTHYEFIEDISRVMNVPVAYKVPKNARLSFILPTIRPELVPMSVKFYQAQTYRERELLIVLNTHDADMTEVEAARKGDDSIKLLQTPADMPVGCAVNLGILNMSGDYWAKMDDDDYYSPNYLADINLYRKAVDFDIAGKGALFNYLEAEDATIVRSWKQADRQTHNFAGGTLVVKNTPENVHWPENVRGYADIEFLTQRLTKGAHISSLDPFSHIQIRRSDSTFHTWTRQAVHANAAFVSDGLSVESVFI